MENTPKEIVFLEECDENAYKCSNLYGLEPLGKSTPYVESLTSYICRLAYKHNIHVVTLINDIIIPNSLENTYLKKGNLTSTSSFLNNGKTVINIINTLEILTERQDLYSLTLLNWSSILQVGFINEKKKWCPKCFNDQMKEGKDLHEPLIWQLKEIDHCAKHLLALQKSCPQCAKQIVHLTNRMVVGYCPYCNTFLGNLNLTEDINQTVFISKSDESIYEGYTYLLQNNNVNLLPTKLAFINFFDKLRREYHPISISKFSKELSSSRYQVQRWFEGIHPPSVEFWVKISEITNFSLLDILLDENIDLKKLKPLIEWKRFVGRRNKIPSNRIEILREQLLEYVKKETYEFSFEQFSKNIGCNVDIIKSKFPELVEEIKTKYRKRREEEKYNRINETKLQLQHLLNDKNQEPQGLKQTLKSYNFTPRVAKRYFPELCKEIADRYRNHTIQSRKKLIEENKKEIKKILVDLHNQGIYPSNFEIKQRHSKPALFKDSYYRNFREKIREELGY